jgi:hypothetical protein
LELIALLADPRPEGYDVPLAFYELEMAPEDIKEGSVQTILGGC